MQNILRNSQKKAQIYVLKSDITLTLHLFQVVITCHKMLNEPTC